MPQNSNFTYQSVLVLILSLYRLSFQLMLISIYRLSDTEFFILRLIILSIDLYRENKIVIKETYFHRSLFVSVKVPY